MGLLDAYPNEPRADKLDLGVGVYKDAQGLTPNLRSVKLAEQRLVEQETTKSNVGGLGAALFAGGLAVLAVGA
ncbi:aromatic amino acid aminotransferase, partial [Pseudomonas aeruginosa]